MDKAAVEPVSDSQENFAECRRQLRRVRLQLERKEIALSEVLEEVDREKQQLKREVSANIGKLVQPILLRLKNSVSANVRPQIAHLEETIRDITSSLGVTLDRGLAKLTPRELEICRLIKSGLRSKEIAILLGLTPATVNKHREGIRRKLGLNGTGQRLEFYLRRK
jgi:DNA-binding CsgD family transcriptional regulator